VWRLRCDVLFVLISPSFGTIGMNDTAVKIAGLLVGEACSGKKDVFETKLFRL
jgi:hypothetical protein